MSKVESLLNRSKTLLRGGDVEGALKDAEEAVRLSNGSQQAQLRRAICLFRLHRVGEAKSLLPYIGKTPEAETWRELITKHDAVRKDAPRIPEVQSTPTPSTSTTQTAPKLRVEWYQTPSIVTIVVYRKNLPKDTAVQILDQRLEVHAPEFEWVTDLRQPIVSKESSFDISPFKLEFKLRKAQTANWDSYTASNKPITVPAPRAADPVIPTSKSTEKPGTTISYSKWEKLEDSDEEEGDKDPMQFFQKLYSNSSPEVQRAMMKSYLESNGTALSTNWNDVGKRTVEPQPPSN